MIKSKPNYLEGPLILSFPAFLPTCPASHPPHLPTPSPAHPAYLGGRVVYSVSFLDAHDVRDRGLRG